MPAVKCARVGSVHVGSPSAKPKPEPKPDPEPDQAMHSMADEMEGLLKQGGARYRGRGRG